MAQYQFKRFKVSKALTAAFLITVLLPAVGLAQAKCQNLFYSVKQAAIDSFRAQNLSKQASHYYMKAAESEMNSTTGNRVERKFTASISQVKQNLKIMQDRLAETIENFKLEARDKKTNGFLNVTYTKYLTKLVLDFQGKPLVTKIRLRKYGLIAESGGISLEKFQPIKSMLDSKNRSISWLEFKIEHPSFENAVLKPRIKFHDQFAKLLENPRAFKMQLENIRNETKALNAERDAQGNVIGQKDQLVDDMIMALLKTMDERVDLKPISETLYERTSYSINLRNSASQEVVNVQLTLDRDIHQYSLVLGNEVKSYDPRLDLSVLEVKVPVQYAHFKDQDLSNVQGLDSVVGLISNMVNAQQAGYSLDKGKFSRAVEVLRN